MAVEDNKPNATSSGTESSGGGGGGNFSNPRRGKVGRWHSTTWGGNHAQVKEEKKDYSYHYHGDKDSSQNKIYDAAVTKDGPQITRHFTIWRAWRLICGAQVNT